MNELLQLRLHLDKKLNTAVNPYVIEIIQYQIKDLKLTMQVLLNYTNLN